MFYALYAHPEISSREGEFQKWSRCVIVYLIVLDDTHAPLYLKPLNESQNIEQGVFEIVNLGQTNVTFTAIMWIISSLGVIEELRRLKRKLGT